MAARGRPKGSTKLPLQMDLDVWLCIEFYRQREQEKTGRCPSVLAACQEIYSWSLPIWIVGGNVKAIANAITQNPQSSLKDLPRQNFIKTDSYPKLVNDKTGPLFVRHKIQRATSLRARYTEANRLANLNEDVRRAWTNMLCDMLGRPRLYSSKPALSEAA
jgi:hypothetical protein